MCPAGRAGSNDPCPYGSSLGTEERGPAGHYDARMRTTLTRATRKPRRDRLEPAALGQPLPGIDLDKALKLAESLEDVEIARNLERRK